METIYIDEKQLRDQIEWGDGPNGCRILVVQPKTTNWYFTWLDDSRYYNPYEEGDFVYHLEALFPYGSGIEQQMAEEVVSENALELPQDEDLDLAGYLEENYGELWRSYVEVQLDFLVDATVEALNGDGSSTNDIAPWGMTYGSDGEPEVIQPPFEFSLFDPDWDDPDDL